MCSGRWPKCLAPPDVTAALALPPDATVIVRKRIVLLDDTPVELADSYYPMPIAAGTRLAEHRKIRGGAVTLLAELGRRLVDIEEDVTARQATEDERLHLQLPDDDWVLVLSRLSRAADGAPIEFMRMVMVARGRHLRYQLKA
ncbi:UTRA domain-containing protein [Nonomuraea ferruginea]